MDIKDRLKEVRDYAKMGQTNFEKHTGISSGYFNKVKSSVGSDTIIKIADKFPELNIEWLITGNGTMLKSETSPINVDGDLNKIEVERKIKRLESSMDALIEQNERLQAELDEYKTKEIQSKGIA